MYDSGRASVFLTACVERLGPDVAWSSMSPLVDAAGRRFTARVLDVANTSGHGGPPRSVGARTSDAVVRRLPARLGLSGGAGGFPGGLQWDVKPATSVTLTKVVVLSLTVWAMVLRLGVVGCSVCRRLAGRAAVRRHRRSPGKGPPQLLDHLGEMGQDGVFVSCRAAFQGAPDEGQRLFRQILGGGQCIPGVRR
ncbi:hypothetical protein [Saccharothrix syringae]|uniref:hypothetical protein n=1 Tax=Saccharothrix syringae TaxID=103733 RepID=UPI00052763BB|nr:hypothetical protein [Saccharothrix syringae]